MEWRKLWNKITNILQTIHTPKKSYITVQEHFLQYFTEKCLNCVDGICSISNKVEILTLSCCFISNYSFTWNWQENPEIRVLAFSILYTRDGVSSTNHSWENLIQFCSNFWKFLAPSLFGHFPLLSVLIPHPAQVWMRVHAISHQELCNSLCLLPLTLWGSAESLSWFWRDYSGLYFTNRSYFPPYLYFHHRLIPWLGIQTNG